MGLRKWKKVVGIKKENKNERKKITRNGKEEGK